MFVTNCYKSYNPVVKTTKKMSYLLLGLELFVFLDEQLRIGCILYKISKAAPTW